MSAWLLLVAFGAGCGSSGSEQPAQEKLEDMLVDCGIYSDGRLPDDMSHRSEREQECIMSCVELATCAQLSEHFCEGTGPLDSCIDDCLDPYDCGAETEVVLCNGFRECLDGRDEEGCHYCDGATIGLWKSRVCDGWEDCDDGSDELGCDSEEGFRCPNGETIPTAWVCDQENDCSGGADELGCATLICE